MLVIFRKAHCKLYFENSVVNPYIFCIVPPQMDRPNENEIKTPEPSRLIWPELAVPIVLERPTDENSPTDIVNFMVGKLLLVAPAVLQADFIAEGPIAWVIRGEGKHIEEVFRSSNRGMFRSVLARFGYRFLDVQLYGGYTQRVLTCGDQRWMCRIYMSNAGGSGFWIRAYAMHRVGADSENGSTPD
jgi:hypothetical protein